MSKKKKLKRIKTILICCGLLLGVYYLLPAAGMAMEPAKAEAYLGFGLLHLIFPLYLYISSIVLGMKQGRCTVYAAAAAVLFLPTLLLYFRPAVWAASPIYGGIALCGNLMGWGLRSLLKKWKNTV